MPKKKAQASQKENPPIQLSQIWDGFLRFLDVFFQFILSLLKLVHAFLKTALWILALAASVCLIAALAFYLIFTALGLKDSPAFQEYRERLITEITSHHIEEFIETARY